MRRAAVLVLKERAEVLEERAGRDALGALGDAAPCVIRLRPLRAHPARRPPPQDHPQGGPRPRRLDLPVLRAPGDGPHRRPRDPPLAAAACRSGTTSSPPARPAIGARATARPTRRVCTRRTGPSPPGPPSSSASPRLGSPTRGRATSRPWLQPSSCSLRPYGRSRPRSAAPTPAPARGRGWARLPRARSALAHRPRP